METTVEGTKQAHSYLPLEVLSHIFQYLPFVDRQNASLTCRHWFAASLDPRFTSRLVICLDHISYLENRAAILRLFAASVRPYANIAIRDCEISGGPEWCELFERLAPHLRFLAIDRCDVSERVFARVIRTLRNLRRLELHCNNQLLMSGRLFEDQTDMSQLKLLHCDELELVSNRYLSDRIMHRFIALCTRLRHLSLKNTNISFHRGLYKRFYPARLLHTTTPPATRPETDPATRPDMDPSNNNNNSHIAQLADKTCTECTETGVPVTNRSETVLTFFNILELVSVHAATLHSLDLSHTLVDNESLVQLATLAGLKLSRLCLTSCDQVSNDGFVQLFQHQPHLVHVDLSCCSRLTDRSVLSLSQFCTGLRQLRLRNCAGLTDIACRGLSERLRSLELLDVSHCIGITGQGLSQLFSTTLTRTPSAPKLHSLVLSGLNIVPREMQPVLLHCSEVRVLDLSHCFTMVTDETLRVLFEHCTRLTELSLVSCENVSDWGLIGLSSRTDHESSSANNSDHSSSPAEHSSSDSSTHTLKLSLGSRAEQEILSDAKRKSAALLRVQSEGRSEIMMTDVGGDKATRMRGLNRAKGLTKLNLYGCSKVTDVSLIHALSHLSHLQDLNLGDIQQISSEGIQALCRSNYRIHSLKLHRCSNLQDSDIQLIATRLKTLHSLDVSSCVRLTDAAVSSLASNCISLRSLNLQKCPSISPAAIDRLAASLSSLHTIVSPSPTSVDSLDATNIPDAPPLSRTGAIRRT